MSEVTQVRPAPSREEWFADLRVRFIEVTRRRVEEAAVEDIVQDALRVIHARGVPPGAGGADEPPALAWAFQVLRNTIGTHYRRTRTLRSRFRPDEEVTPVPDPSPGPDEAFASAEALSVVHQALADLAARGDRCAHYLRRLAQGATPRAVAAGENLPEPVLYRRVYRCRQKLRDLLRARGLEV